MEIRYIRQLWHQKDGKIELTKRYHRDFWHSMLNEVSDFVRKYDKCQKARELKYPQTEFIGNKAKERISKQAFQENKARQICFITDELTPIPHSTIF